MMISVFTATNSARRAISFALLAMSPLAGGACNGDGDAAEVRTVEAPDLYIPFAAGTSRVCTQGNGGTDSHKGTQTFHALDLDTDDGETVVSALAGRVGYVKSDCPPGNAGCGGGFGNYVKLDHGGGYYTLYAHLGVPAVKTGDMIGRGVALGKEGGTGETSGSHLHFSLHVGDPMSAAVEPTVGFVMRARDDTQGEGTFSNRGSGDFVCGLPTGHRYASDNACLPVYESLGDAKVIANETVYAGEFCGPGDVDYFYFSGGAGGFAARVTPTEQSIAACSCAILDQNGAELQRGDAEGYERNDAYGDGAGCECKLASAPAAKYFLKVFADVPGKYYMDKALP